MAILVHKRSILVCLLLGALFGLFQNCTSKSNFGGRPTAIENSANGQPYQGKIYVQRGPLCSDQSDVNAKIELTGPESAQLTKDNCLDIPAVPLGPLDFAINKDNPTLLNYGNRVFTQVPTPRPNAPNGLISNASFESGLSGWSTYGTVQVISDGQYSGAGGVLVGPNINGAAEHDITPVVSPGVAFSVRAVAKVAVSGTTGYVGCKFWNSSNAVISDTGTPVTSSEYTQVMLSCTVPSTAVRSLIYGWNNFGQATLYLDDFVLTVP